MRWEGHVVVGSLGEGATACHADGIGNIMLKGKRSVIPRVWYSTVFQPLLNLEIPARLVGFKHTPT